MATSHWHELAERLKRTLGLHYPPIAITFRQDMPEGTPLYDAAMPSPSTDGRTGKVAAGCVFWVKAEDRTFATIPGDHFNCSIGSVTHGLKTLEEVMGNDDVRSMLEFEWVTPEVAGALPVIQTHPKSITYGPLAQTSVDPDVILLRVNAFQAMVIHDAFDDMPIVGRPQCHIIPIAKEQNQIALSTGCMLSRIRTGMLPTEMTCAVPGGRLEEVVEKLEARQRADAAVGSYANQDARRFRAD